MASKHFRAISLFVPIIRGPKCATSPTPGVIEFTCYERSGKITKNKNNARKAIDRSHQEQGLGNQPGPTAACIQREETVPFPCGRQLQQLFTLARGAPTSESLILVIYFHVYHGG